MERLARSATARSLPIALAAARARRAYCRLVRQPRLELFEAMVPIPVTVRGDNVRVLQKKG